ncbi:bromodomain-containing protein 3 [Drosophila tropicalis]|uniref:bromodomain-containing protein 3 n=1 Tax=Drosophila tropicalis TaxID=46794 RepID=UPI0035ABD422
MSKGLKGEVSKSVAELNACKALLKNLMSPTYKKLAWIFYEPVDSEALGLDDYHEIVKEPMDLGTIKERLDADDYEDATEFAKDVRLIFFNAYLYTNSGHVCYQMAKELQLIFEKMFTELLNDSTQLLEIADKEEEKVDSNPVDIEDDDDVDIEDDDGDVDDDVDDDEDQDDDADDNDNDDDEDDDDEGDDVSDVSSPVELPEDTEDKKPIHSFDGDEVPFTPEEDLDLHAKIQQLDGEHLLKIIHIIRQMEDTKSSNKEIEIDVRTMKTRTKRSIESFMASRNITGRRRTCIKYQN